MDRVVVCGCGPSVELMAAVHMNFVTVGCNDVDRWFPPNHLVLGDRLSCYHGDRRKTIQGTGARTVWLRRGDSLGHRDEREIEVLEVHDQRVTPSMLDEGPLISFLMTPYLAIHLAYRLGARRIGLLGVDLVSPSPLRFHHGVISRKLSELAEALAAKSVELGNLSSISQVVGLPAMDLQGFAT